MRARWMLCVATFVSVALLSGCGWSSMRSDAAHTGHELGETKIGTSNVASLHNAWTIESDKPFVGLSPIAPVVAGGRLYAAAPDAIKVYDAAGVNGCSGSPKTCQPLW